ncbi:phosphate butyryltransferase [Bacillus taeanensis]|uniref:Phosphate butyryltransferase n=1 Tax=Bacillus taeanensis TaxID=273032 RepID=A0A366Y344_9BACI|nr:phosphate butyryltransferase [Bacillus taeanensis]RBW70621.1 phosphate butyryltransferase [Bacillus taeanensis]
MSFKMLIKKAAELPNKRIAVAAAEDDAVIEAVKQAVDEQLASFLLFGHEQQIRTLLDKEGSAYSSNDHISIIAANSPEESVELAVKAVHNNKADVLMKGRIPTAMILRAVLHKEYGLRSGKILSHVAAFDIEGFNKFIFVTDAAMNIAPDLDTKVEIIRNGVAVARALGVEMPRVAPIAAVEVINPNMQATLDAAALTVMNQRGQIKNCIIDGPLALDNAVSMDAAQHKGIKSDVAGQADLLIVPTIEVGNVLYKSLVYFAKAKVGAVLAGSKVPIVLTSRADSAESKYYSIALAVCSVS